MDDGRSDVGGRLVQLEHAVVPLLRGAKWCWSTYRQEEGGNGGLGATSREALAAEIEGVRDSLMDQANASYAGRSVFAGT
ncbi:hypothetical protein OMK64_08140, partial [Cellulomonas fimi]|nr:hypothetical protein [Cellulomonas fimi]